jgi:zinc transport system substrate-binding protein
MTPRTTLLLILAAVSVAAGGQRNKGPSDTVTVSVSVLPQREFVQRIAGDLARIEVLVLPGHSPATFEPTPRQMTHLAEADLWVRIGVPFEGSVLRNLSVVAPNLRIVDGTQDVELVAMDGSPIPSDSSPGAGHDHLIDPHFWLDPLLVKDHAQTIASAMCGLMPSRCDQFRANLAGFHTDLDAVHQRISRVLTPVAGRDLFVFHPAYGYFGRRYGLRQVAVESGGRQPTARRLAELTEVARASRVRALFVQPQFAGTGARAVADAMEVELVELDPLAPDYLANLETMAARIAAAYGE